MSLQALEHVEDIEGLEDIELAGVCPNEKYCLIAVITSHIHSKTIRIGKNKVNYEKIYENYGDHYGTNPRQRERYEFGVRSSHPLEIIAADAQISMRHRYCCMG